jgi:hypothetical protein
MSRPSITSLPAWHQPIGTWRARGASTLCLRAGLGLSLQRSPNDAEVVDTAGYTAWHYWANSPRPHQTFQEACRILGSSFCNQLSAAGEHPWHFLLMAGQRPALDAWVLTHGHPEENERTGDTFSHCAAWSGEQAILEAFGEQELTSINRLDEQGLSPLIIAIHRGNEAFVESFLMSGADPMVADPHGRTALHHAAQYGDAGLVALLEDAGGEIDARDLQGLSASDVLKTRRNVPPRDLAILREHWRKRKQHRLPF